MKKYCFCLIVSFLISSGVKASCGSGQWPLIVQIVPDNYFTETSWSLYDDSTHERIDSGRYTGDTICVSSSRCFKFTIYDAYGDGMCCAFGTGSYTVILNGDTVARGGHFQYSESAYFNCAAGHDCTDPLTAVMDTMTASKPDTWYVFHTDSTGMYNISTCDLGNTCNTKIYIYDHCTGLIPTENNQGTTFYNDSGCANNQSLVTAAMPAGRTYYIRIGDADTNCADHSITWQIEYAGPIMGCTDTASCNFNPLATVSDGGCVYPPNPLCPAPDLMVVQQDIENSLRIDNLSVQQNDCFIHEGCLAGYGTRRLIRFTTHIKNIGDADYYIGVPDSSNNQFVWDPCHQHWHYVGYAEYLLFDANNQQVQQGFKDGFCVLDLECSDGGSGKYSCDNMGISAGCGDIYDSHLDCQWVDITEVDTGNYTLVVRVNWGQSTDKLGRHEKTYDNNWAQVCLHLYDDINGNKLFDILPTCPPYIDCAGDTFGHTQLDCKGVCGGSALRGDLDSNQLRDTTDLLLYLSGSTDETLHLTTCNDLNGDGHITVVDAARLNGCLRHLAGTLTNPNNAQTAQHLCEFPYNIYNPNDGVEFSIAEVDWLHHYFDIGIYNSLTEIMGYELKIGGATIDSVKNLATGNYIPDIRFSSIGHITELSNEDSALPKQLAPLNFLRVYYSGLHDSTLCIEKVIDAVNEEYEQISIIDAPVCITYHSDTAVNIQEITEKDITLVPNPSNGIFDLYVSNQSLLGASIRIFDVMGRLVYDNPYNTGLSNNLKFDLSSEENGVYLLNINMKGMSVTRRLILAKQ